MCLLAKKELQKKIENAHMQCYRSVSVILLVVYVLTWGSSSSEHLPSPNPLFCR